MALTTADDLLMALEQSRLLTKEQWERVRRFVHKACSTGSLTPEPYTPETYPHRVSTPSPDGGSSGEPLENTFAADEILTQLVIAGDLTSWQAEELLNGRTSFRLGKYTLLELIGAGGMGEVYKAEHAVMGRTVALKVLSRARLDNPTAVARFRREVKAAAKLDHPNIVTAHDAGQFGQDHFLVMEYVDGQDLNAYLLRQGPLPISWACEFIRQAALGLSHAHLRGLVHRDIKPANLLVRWPPEQPLPAVKILDLGLARFNRDLVDDRLLGRSNTTLGASKNGLPLERTTFEGLTAEGHIVGTPDYLSPEQILGTGRVDPRSDLFALGCTLFKLLTGQLPFAGHDLAEKVQARIDPNAPPAISIRLLLPSAPPELDGVLSRMLMRDPNQRFQTGIEVATALAPFSLSAQLAARAGEDNGSEASSISGFGRDGALLSPDDGPTQFDLSSPQNRSAYSPDQESPKNQEHIATEGTDFDLNPEDVALSASNPPARSLPTSISQASRPSQAVPEEPLTIEDVPILNHGPAPDEPLAGWTPQLSELSDSHSPSRGPCSWLGGILRGLGVFVLVLILTISAGYLTSRLGGVTTSQKARLDQSSLFSWPDGPVEHANALRPRHGAQLDLGGMTFGGGPQERVDCLNFGDVLLENCRRTGELTVLAVIQTNDLDQSGPARIVSFSTDSQSRNFTLGQQGDQLIFRLRTSQSDNNGTSPQITLGPLRAGDPIHVVLTYRQNDLRYYVNGRVEKVPQEQSLKGTLENWEPQQLVFGNEHQSSRPWVGTLRRIALYSRVLNGKEIRQDYLRQLPGRR